MVFRPNTIIGANSIVSHLCVSEGDVVIGELTTIEPQCHLTMGLRVGNYCFFGPCVVTMNTKKIAHCRDYVARITPPRIMDGVRIGAGAVIGPGTLLEHNSFVKAGTRASGVVRASTSIKEVTSRVREALAYDERVSPL